MPSFGAPTPLSYVAVPASERDTRCEVGPDHCVIDGTSFFVRGCIEIPVVGQTEPLVWGAWVSLSRPSFDAWRRSVDEPERRHVGPFFGWLNTRLPPYPDTLNLKTRVHLRDAGIRPCIELEPTDHPLAVEQRSGISVQRVAQLHALMLQDPTPRASPGS